MLKVTPRRSATLTCPRHPRRQYTVEEAAAKTKEPCDTCHAIFEVRLACDGLDRAQRKAFEAINRTNMPRAVAATEG